MNSPTVFHNSLKVKHIVYGILLSLAFSWPWIWMAATGRAGEGDLVDLLSLGLFPVLIIGTFIMFKESSSRPNSYKVAFTIAMAAALLLVWIIPAVGIYGRSGDPADLPYYGVLAVGVAGALISRFRPKGMFLTMGAMAVSQISVSLLGLITEIGAAWILNVFFAGLWTASAWLFMNAEKK